MKAIYAHRDFVAIAPAVALLLALISLGLKEATHLKPKYDEPVKIEIVTLPDLVPEPPVPAAEPTPPETSVKPPLPAPPKQAPRPEPKIAPANPVAAPQAPAAPVADPSPAPAQAAPARATSPAAPAPSAPAPSAPVQAAATQAPPNADAEYIARVRAYLDSIKRYPTGRDASTQRPKGTVKVWFVLRRDGSLVEAGIEESSNSILLDEAARKTALRATFPPFPDQFKPSMATHRFTVDLQFAPAG